MLNPYPSVRVFPLQFVMSLGTIRNCLQLIWLLLYIYILLCNLILLQLLNYIYARNNFLYYLSHVRINSIIVLWREKKQVAFFVEIIILSPQVEKSRFCNDDWLYSRLCSQPKQLDRLCFSEAHYKSTGLAIPREHSRIVHHISCCLGLEPSLPSVLSGLSWPNIVLFSFKMFIFKAKIAERFFSPLKTIRQKMPLGVVMSLGVYFCTRQNLVFY